MLILRRKIGESIVIGEEITIKILGINGKQVKLGIEAPAHIPVHRLEILERIKQENTNAAILPPNLDSILLKTHPTSISKKTQNKEEWWK